MNEHQLYALSYPLRSLKIRYLKKLILTAIFSTKVFPHLNKMYDRHAVILINLENIFFSEEMDDMKENAIVVRKRDENSYEVQVGK